MALLPARAGASEPITSFQVTNNAAIAGFNIEHLTSLTPSECAMACLARGWCKSFDYYKFENSCDLSDKSADDVGGLKTDYPGSPYDHYSSVLNEFSFTPNAAISGFNTEHLTSITPSECATACLARRWCKSFDYYKFQNSCDLSDKSADDVGGLKTDYPGNPYDHYGRPNAHDALAALFAPRLRFDGAGHGYPMSAQTFYDVIVRSGSTGRLENTNPSTLGSGQIPTYYQVIECGEQVRIKYWWFYGYQKTCDGVSGSHNGDWENVVVTLSEDQSRIAAITFSMHGKTYTRLATRGGFTVEDGTHPVVYVGKTSHAAFYNQGGSSNTCLPWEEYRNNTTGLHLNSWSNLVNLDRPTGPSDWIVADRQGGFSWGYDGISTHPTQSPPSCSMRAATWSAEIPTWWHSQCKKSDRDDGTSCHVQCRPGYTDMGLTCTNWSTWDTYNQKLYDYDYRLPASDVGLLTNDYD